MALYESTFIANQELTSKQVDDLAQNFIDFLKHAGGKLIKQEYWGVRNFAYTIKKQKKGHYVMLCIEAEPEALESLNKKISTREEVLKLISFKVDAFSANTSNLAKTDED